MILYPTIELQNGRPVSLFRGRLNEPQIWHVDPVARAREFAAAGAEWLHVTDMDAVAGTGNNNAILEDLILHANLPVQLGGGFRSIEAIETWIDKGAGRIVLGTIAVVQPDLVKRAARRWPDQIVLAVDVWQGRVMSHGWEDKSSFAPVEFVQAFDEDPLAAIIVTDIHADIGEAEEPLALVTQIAAASNKPVISRGLVRDLDGLSRLKYVPHVAGALVGRALFDRSIDFAEALALANAPLEKQAEFI